MDYKKKLLNMIGKVLTGQWSVPEFESGYYMFFVEQVPEEALSTDEMMLFSEIQEKLDFVVENPPAEDRKYGYINYVEYVEWLKNFVEKNKNHLLSPGNS